jgi:hypothetical protein
MVLTAPGSLSRQGDGYVGPTGYKKRQQAEENPQYSRHNLYPSYITTEESK